jgi:hypothetical protein
MDPFFEVKAEVTSSLTAASTLHSSYARILRTLPQALHLTSEELSWALAELKATLSGLEVEVDELEEMVGLLTEDGGGAAKRLGISTEEVRERETFVKKVRKDIKVNWTWSMDER